MAAMTLTLAFTAMLLVLAPVALHAQDLNTYQYMLTYNQKGHDGAKCGQEWNRIKTQFFSGSNAACGDIVFSAMNETIPARCPRGLPYPRGTGDAIGGTLWMCMTGNGNNTELKSAYANFVQRCEIFYVAQRDQVEGEDGFVAKDNSCLRRFGGMPSFRTYLDGQWSSGAKLFVRLLPTLAVAMMVALGLAKFV